MAEDSSPPSLRRRARRRRSPGAEGFYATALSEAERVLLPQARKMEGLDEEIALLRVRLKAALAEHPENLPLLLKGMELLVKAVAAKYRLSKKAEDDLYQNVLGVLRGVGGALWPEGFDGV
ncbi:MAG: hypothetical protein Q8O76_15675 [Chloroflexota bacterium]|nr:hypothetical protein [Chloroflexota bacterium]